MFVPRADIEVALNLNTFDLEDLIQRQGYPDEFKTSRFIGINEAGEFVFEVQFYNKAEGCNDKCRLYVAFGENGTISADY